jgi:capsular polysaccharide biosynthesis protein
LHVETEFSVLTPFAHVADVFAAPIVEPGALTQITSPEHIEERDLVDRLKDRIGGSGQPPWADGSGGGLKFGVCLCRVKDAFYVPEFGAMITPDGAVLKSSVGEALYLTPDLAALPGVSLIDGAAVMRLPDKIRTLPSATVFVAWGGRFNYGHFLLDCLSALCVIDHEGLLDRFPAIAPKLTSWHRELLSLMLGPKAAKIQEINDDVVKIEDALFSSPMDHFLHAPNAPLDTVRSRILSRLPQNRASGPERIYLSRRKDEKRRMLNEAELEARLRTMNFEIVHPQKLSVEAQIQLFRTAKVIVGPTGAAFANCLFSPPSAKVFEIQPTQFTGVWARGLCHYCALYWHGYFASSTPNGEVLKQEMEQSLDGVFDWTLDIADFMTFLTPRLDDLS